MSLFTNLTGDKRRDKEILADIRSTLGDELYSEKEAEAFELGRVVYSVLKINGKVRAAKPWDKLKPEEKLRWGGIAVDIMDAVDEQYECDEEDETDGSEAEGEDDQKFIKLSFPRDLMQSLANARAAAEDEAGEGEEEDSDENADEYEDEDAGEEAEAGSKPAGSA